MPRPQFDLIVFSHLRWEFVTQRPQHLLTRLAKRRRVLFIEEPVNKTKVIKVTSKLHVLQPGVDRQHWVEEAAPLIKRYQKKFFLKNPILWFYSPAFVGILEQLNDFSAVIYDCMDELSAFAGASKQLVRQERALLKQADVVFTGGKSLYEAKAKLHPQVYCFPSSVDEKHFARALSRQTKVPADVKRLPQPTVGYIGVIDERINLRLLGQAAQNLPEVSFVMIGPLAKIDPKKLPRQDNIYYLGSKPYARLPSYLKGLTIAMMPFALNRATKFISPTKTPEFMAAGKPVISTPVRDVVRSYGKVVAIVDTVKDFSQAVKKYLTERARQKQHRLRQYQQILKKTSWDRTAKEMESIIEQVLSNKYA